MKAKRVKKVVSATQVKVAARTAAKAFDLSDELHVAADAAFAAMPEADRQDVLLGFMFHDLARMRRRANDQFMKPFGLTRAQWWVLAQLARQDGMTQTALADKLEMGKANLGVVVEGLEAGGWVERIGQPSDMRAKRVFMTRAATALVKRMFEAEAEFNTQTLGELAREERDQLFNLLARVKLGVGRLETSTPARDD